MVPRLRGVEGRILGQDLLLQTLQRRAGVDAELLGQGLPRRSVAVERLRLPAAAIQREHVLSPEPLAQWVLGDEGRELRDHLRLATACEVGVDPPLERTQPELLQASDGRQRERLVEVGERRSPPQVERLAQRRGGLRRPVVVEGLDPRLGEPLEPAQVQFAGLHGDRVAASAGRDRVLAQRVAQIRDVALQDVGGGLGRLVPPDVVDQPARGDDLVRVQEQHREHRALPRPTQRQRTALIECLERSEDPVLDRHGRTVAPRGSGLDHWPAGPSSARPALVQRLPTSWRRVVRRR